MTSALAVDGARGPALPSEFKVPQRQAPEPSQSPLPSDWSDSSKPLRDLGKLIDELFGN